MTVLTCARLTLKHLPSCFFLHQAKRIQSLRGVFGERYPDPVRVLSVGQDVSSCFCSLHLIAGHDIIGVDVAFRALR